MPKLYLIGGGWDEGSFQHTYGRFVRAGTKHGRCTILLVLAIENLAARKEITEDFTQMFYALGNMSIEPFFLSTTQNITRDILHAIQPTCIFVGGGLTPRYQEFLGNNNEFIEYILQHNLPYGGFSAGSAIAAQTAIVGGWKITESGHDIPILCLNENARNLPSRGAKCIFREHFLRLFMDQPYSFDNNCVQSTIVD